MLTNELTILLKAVREASAQVMSLPREDFSINRKADRSLVTEADKLVNDTLSHHLTRSFPEYGWLSEESRDNPERLNKARVWIVDPIDGTKEFIAGIPEYAISVALVEKGTPLLACVLNPATNELFYAIKGQGAWLGDCKIHCADRPQDIILLASRSEYARGEWEEFEKMYPVAQVGSIAYKLALIAAGRAQATFSLGPKNEWDIAAGALLVSEAGGIVTNIKHENFIYNQPKTLVDGIVATTKEMNEKIFSLISTALFL